MFVELSRHSHDAPAVAGRSLEFLGNLIETAGTNLNQPFRDKESL